jgi:UDPglucose 6-dehydrogenase
VRAYDPEGAEEAGKLLPDLLYCESAYETMGGADALLIITEWNQFRALDWSRVRRLMKAPVVVDLRNIYKPAEMAAAGFEYISIGRAPAAPAKAPKLKLA